MIGSNFSHGGSAADSNGVERFRWPLMLLILALGTFLRFYRIGNQGLWIDEAFSIWLTRRPVAEMLRWVTEVDHHPPLYYALLRAWTSLFGWEEAAVRALSALFGTATIPVIYLLGRRLVDTGSGLAAALMLAISPFHVRFAQEARMYTLLGLCSSLALYAFVTLYGQRARSCSYSREPADDGPSSSEAAPGNRPSPAWWVSYVVFTGGTLWTHNTAVLLPVATNLVVLCQALSVGDCVLPPRVGRAANSGPGDRGGATWWKGWFLAQVAVVALWLPWLPSFLSQAVDVVHRFWLPDPTLGTVLSIVGSFLCDFLPWPFWAVLFSNVGLAVLALLGLRELHRHSAPAALLGGMFIVPLLSQWLVSQWRPILYARTLIWISIPLYLMMSIGVIWLGRHVRLGMRSRAAALIPLAALAATSAVGLVNYYGTFEKEAWDEAAALVAERARKGDLVLFGDAWGQVPFDYYFRQLYNPGDGPGVAEHGLPVDLFERGVLEPEMRERDLPRLRRLVAGRQRVWLVYSHQWYTDPEGLIPRALDKALEPRRRWVFQGLQVHLYVDD